MSVCHGTAWQDRTARVRRRPERRSVRASLCLTIGIAGPMVSVFPWPGVGRGPGALRVQLDRRGEQQVAGTLTDLSRRLR